VDYLTRFQLNTLEREFLFFDMERMGTAYTGFAVPASVASTSSDRLPAGSIHADHLGE